MLRDTRGEDCKARVLEEFPFYTFLSLGDGSIVRFTQMCADLAQGKGGVAPAQDNRFRKTSVRAEALHGRGPRLIQHLID